MKDVTLYILGDTTQTTIQDFIKTLSELQFTVKTVTEDEAINTICNTACHLVIVLSINQDINTIRIISQRALMNGAHLYFVGDPASAFPGGAHLINSISGSHFPGLPVNYYLLSCAIECNERERKNILVVDDDPIMLRSVKVWLEDSFEVTLVNSGEMAMEYLDKNTPDLILLDYKMPSMSGPNVLKAIRSNHRLAHIPVIFLTGRNDKESVIQVMQLKPEGYILKNKKPEEIKGAVADFFKNRIAFYED